MIIARAIEEHAQSRPDHPAIEDRGQVVTYRDLDRRVDRAAANLRAAGVDVGDIVGVTLPDSAELLVAFLALARAGAAILPIDGRLPQAEREQLITDLSIKAAIVADGVAFADRSPTLTIGSVCGPASAADPFAAPALDADHPLLCGQSSGTTGKPKLFQWSHGRVRDWAVRYMENDGWTADDRYLAVIGAAFNFGARLCFGILYAGATVVIPVSREPDDLITLIRGQGITTVFLTPSHLRPLLRLAGGGAPAFPSLRAMFVSTAPVTPEERRAARKLLTPNFFESYAANETGLLVVAMPADQDAYPNSIGRAVRGVEAQVVDENDQSLPPEAVGHIRFRVPGLPEGYLKDPEATAHHFRDGWFYPGDLAAINAEGYIFLKGRADDMISNEGAKFYPIELENALLRHPQVAEAAAFGWPHTRFGEVAVAFVAARGRVTVQDLARFCLQHIEPYKLPHWIGFLPRLPRNPMGKILKSELRETFDRQRNGEPLS